MSMIGSMENMDRTPARGVATGFNCNERGDREGRPGYQGIQVGCLARQIVETGRVVNRRYLLQRLLRQGQFSAVYVGTDQVLQRPVAVKVVPAPYIQDYRAAIKLTAQFSHPNIIGLYDLVVETDVLYVVQEYVEGDDFATLLQKALSVFEVVDLGSQMCQALVYAGNSPHRVTHGDLTPGAVIRDRSGLVRVNNFALPSDQPYRSEER